MQAVTEHFAGSGFKVFAGMIERDPKVEVWAIPAPGGGSRAFCDRMNSWAQGEGQPGLGYIFFREGERRRGAGPIAKNIGPERDRPRSARSSSLGDRRRGVLRRRQSRRLHDASPARRARRSARTSA